MHGLCRLWLPALLIQLLLGLAGEAEVVGALRRHDVLDLGDKFDDGEIVSLSFLVDVAGDGECLDEIVVHADRQ